MCALVLTPWRVSILAVVQTTCQPRCSMMSRKASEPMHRNVPSWRADFRWTVRTRPIRSGCSTARTYVTPRSVVVAVVVTVVVIVGLLEVLMAVVVVLLLLVLVVLVVVVVVGGGVIVVRLV